MLVYLDVDRLDKIAEKAASLKTKRGKWKSTAWRSKKMSEIIHDYGQFWVELVKKLVPEYDREKHLINMLAIEVSPFVDALIESFLPGSAYLFYSPRTNPDLKENECIVHLNKILIDRNDASQRWHNASA